MINNIVRELNENDVKGVVEIHLSAFQGFFLSSLGKVFLKKYYKAVLSNENGITIGYFNHENRLIGFAIGCKYAKGFHKKLVKTNLLTFFFEGIRLLFFRPQALIRLFRNISKQSNINDDGKYAELLSIGILKSEIGKGYGKAILANFEIKVKEYDINRICLTTDKFENEKTLKFYESADYGTFYEFVAYPNRNMFKLIKYL